MWVRRFMNLLLDSLPSILTVMNTAVLSHHCFWTLSLKARNQWGMRQWWRDSLVGLSPGGKENEI